MTAACDWCGHPGHTPDDHPLPAGHEHYDAVLDDPDHPIQAALGDFTDWRDRNSRGRLWP